jgi:ribonuclease HI|tara:strand:- start:64 stop:537 length:474 start_codon:yes stop_codon:yes gene_type:complete
MNISQKTIQENYEGGDKIKEKKEDNYLLRFDGASKGNPGISGSGAVLYLNDEEIWSTSIYLEQKQTNNYAEYVGVLIGLQEAVNRCIKKLHVEGDSMLVIKQLNGEWKVKSENLIKVYKKCNKLAKKISKITFSHIYRDNNKRADELANMAILNKKK